MKHRVIASVVAMAFATVVSTTVACPEHDKTVRKDEPAAKLVQNTVSPCGAKTATTATATVYDGRSEVAATATGKSTPCGKKAAALAAQKDKPCCGKCGKKDAKLAAKGGCSKPCGKSADGGCPIDKKVEAVLASMPSMKYRVGDEVTGCSKSAKALAKKSGKPLGFVVGDNVLSDEDEALGKLTALLESEAQTMRSLQFVAGGKCSRCPMTAKDIAKKTGTTVAYRVGGVDFSKKADAEKALARINDVIANVKMEYKVDGKTYGCDKMAGSKCKKSGKKMTYLVGSEETPCQVTAKRMLAEAKVRKIVEAAVSTSFSL